MGEVLIDYPTFFKPLRAGGFKRSMTYEMCSPLLYGADIETLDRYARKFLEYVKKADFGVGPQNETASLDSISSERRMSHGVVP